MAVTLDQLQSEDDAYAKQVVDQQAAQKTKETFQPDTQKAEPSFISKFMTATGRVSTDTLDWAVNAADSINKWRGRVGQDVGAGLVTGATNIADAAGSAISSSGKGLAAAEDPAHAEDAEEGSLPTSPIWDHAKSTILDFRDAIAVKDPTLSDNLIQGAAQLAVPFTGYSRALSGLHGFANLVAANALTDATALGPHDARMADLISLGRHVEGKLGTALNALSPNGSAQNAYINYLADRGDETEAEGRFKNVLDGFGANAIVTPLFHAVASALKHGTAGLRHAVENGITSTSDMAAQPSAVAEGYQRLDMSMTPEQRAFERERIAAARDREEGVAQDVVPEPISRRAAETEGEAARRDRADQIAARPADARAWGSVQPNPAQMAPKGDGVGPVTSAAFPPVAASATEVSSGMAQNRSTVNTLRKVIDKFNEQGGPTEDAGPDGLGQKPFGQGMPLHNAITTLNKGLSRSTPQGVFYGEILDRLQDKKLPTEMVASGTGAHSGSSMEALGTYNDMDDTMAIHSGAIAGNNQTLLHTFVHEAVHAATMKAIGEQPEVAEALKSIFEDAEKSPAIAKLSDLDRYGLSRTAKYEGKAPIVVNGKPMIGGNPMVHEFTAEAEANPRFRKALKDTPSEHGGTLWDDYKAVIGGILGVSGVMLASPQFDKLLTKEKTGA